MKTQLFSFLIAIFTTSSIASQCFSPSVAILTNISQTDVTVEWIDFAGATAFDVQIVPHGDPSNGTPVAQGVTSPYTWTSAVAGEVYDVYVRAQCPPPNSGQFSAYSGPIYFQAEPVNCVNHTVFNPPLEYTTDPNISCETVSDNIDLNGDGLDDLFVIVFDECIDPFYGANSPSSVRLNGLGAEGVRFVSIGVTVNENGADINANGVLPMTLGTTILTTELSGQPDLVNHGDDYGLWEGQGVRYIGFDLMDDDFAYNGWIKAEAADEYLKIYEVAINNRIDDPMQVGQLDCVYCPADFDLDGFVTIDDFLSLNSTFGTNCVCQEDLDGNGVVNVNDFINFNSAFGVDCSTLVQGDDLLRISEELLNEIEKREDIKIHPELQKIIDEMTHTPELSLFPNPSNGEELNFSIEGMNEMEGTGRVSVVDLTGKTIYLAMNDMEVLTQQGRLSFDQKLNPGLYIMSIELDGAVYTERFTVQ